VAISSVLNWFPTIVNMWHWHPPVGVWIGILGLLGVLVLLFRDLPAIGKSEKVVCYPARTPLKSATFEKMKLRTC